MATHPTIGVEEEFWRASSSSATGPCGSGGHGRHRGEVADVIAELATATLSNTWRIQ